MKLLQSQLSLFFTTTVCPPLRSGKGDSCDVHNFARKSIHHSLSVRDIRNRLIKDVL